MSAKAGLERIARIISCALLSFMISAIQRAQRRAHEADALAMLSEFLANATYLADREIRLDVARVQAGACDARKELGRCA